MRSDILAVEGLQLSFGGILALDDVALHVQQGAIAGLIGPNGAGKTSLLNCVCRFYQSRHGEIWFDGHDLLRCPPHALAALGLARTFQHTELFSSMSVLDNVLVGAHTVRRPNVLAEALALPAARRATRTQRGIARQALAMLGIDMLEGRVARTLPLGLQKRVALARAIVSRPRLLLLDEPAAGLNTTEKRELAILLRKLRDDLDLSMLLIEHDMDLVMGLCDEITVLDFGKRIAFGPPAAIRRDPNVVAAYLGPGYAPLEVPT